MNASTSTAAARLPSVISIDPPMSTDLDDAVAVTERPDGGYVVDVCLPDVPTLVAPGDQADIHAREVGFTRYGGSFIRRAMFDERIVSRLSLSPGGSRPMVWVRLEVSADLAVESVEIKRINHRTRARLTYLQADEALSDVTRPLHAEVSRLWALSQRLYARRHAETGALFDTGNRVCTSEEGMLQMLGAKDSHQSHLIVMEMMILTNSALADYARRNGIPVLYRNHKPTDTSSGFRRSIVAELAEVHAEGLEQAAGRLKHLAARIGPATLGTSCEGHWGLDLPAYAWFTSPLRRYCDVVNLRALLDGHTDPDLVELGGRLTALYVEEKERSGAFHAERSRMTITRHVLSGHESMLPEFDLHTILRACAEAEVHDDMVVHELYRRMAGGQLSGKDMEYIFTYGREILRESVVQEFVEWLLSDEAAQAAFARDMVQRQRLVRVSTLPDGPPAIGIAIGQIAEICRFDLPPSYRERIERERAAIAERPKAAIAAAATDEPDQTVVPVQHPNPKGALLELAAASKAKVTFDQGGREGPSHKPWFTVTVTWNLKGTAIARQGSGPSLKHAEKVAAYELLTSVQTSQPDATPQRPAFDAGAHPKSVLLEYAASNAGRLEFGKPVVTGPPHAPSFEIEAIYRQGREERRGKGSGTSKKQAEREACSQVLASISAA